MEELRNRILQALDRAISNGHDEIDQLPAILVAEDLCDYDVDFEHMQPQDLVLIVKEWQQRSL
jgi:hypothetical protein